MQEIAIRRYSVDGVRRTHGIEVRNPRRHQLGRGGWSAADWQRPARMDYSGHWWETDPTSRQRGWNELAHLRDDPA